MGRMTTRSSASGPDGGASVDSMAGRAVGGSRPDAFGATEGTGAEVPSAQQQIQGVQQSIRDRSTDALQQGVQRNRRAQP